VIDKGIEKRNYSFSKAVLCSRQDRERDEYLVFLID